MVSVSEEGEGGPPKRVEGPGLPPGGQKVTGGRDGNVVDSGGGTLAELGGVHRGHDPPGGGAPGTGGTLATTAPQTDLRRQAMLGQHIGSTSSKIPSMSNKKAGTKAEVVQRNYALNDIGALKKKLSQETNTEPFSIGKEAKDGSNITITMRASVFERVKQAFVEELSKDNRITKISNGLAATVNVGNSMQAAAAVVTGSGNKVAIVEYSMDISFGKEEKAHSVKMTAYSTTSSIMIQPKGEKAEMYAHLGGRCSPRYFAETFLLPWCEKEVASNNFDPQKMIQAIKDEIKRLEDGKKKLESPKQGGKRAKSLAEVAIDTGKKFRNIMAQSKAKGDFKCVSNNCQYRGKINPINKNAVGNCHKCGEYEHFVCGNISSEEKEEIIKGSSKFFCSECFGANPLALSTQTGNSMSLPEADTPTLRPNSMQSSSVEEMRSETVLKETPTAKDTLPIIELEEEAEAAKTSNELENNIVQTNPKTHMAQVHAAQNIEERQMEYEMQQHGKEGKQEENSEDEDDEDDVFDGSDDEVYYCVLCDFRNKRESAMENHALDKHIETEEDGLYHCQDDCEYTSKEKQELLTHYRRVHKEEENKTAMSTPEDMLNSHSQAVQKSKEQEIEKIDDNLRDKQSEVDENLKLKEEIKVLQRNFKRLEGMYQEALDEVNQVKSEYEAKLIAANDKFSVTKAENETLKEKVDILFKLGKSYLEKSNNTNKINKSPEDPDIIEVLEDDEVEKTTNDDMMELVKNKLSGYRKGNPATQFVPNTNTKIPKQIGKNSAKPNTKTKHSDEDEDEEEKKKTKDNYCHYFVNWGRCTYEQRTGVKCKYDHKKAPDCKFGSGCKRSKCQYFHRKTEPFLGVHRMQPYSPWQNPWKVPQTLPQTNQTWQNQGRNRHIPAWQINPWVTPMPWSPQMEAEWPPLRGANRRNQ